MAKKKHVRNPQQFQKRVMAGVALLLVVTMIISLVATVVFY